MYVIANILIRYILYVTISVPEHLTTKLPILWIPNGYEVFSNNIS